MDDQGYKNLLTHLEEGKCALILGPEFFLLDSPEGAESFRDNIYKNQLSKSPYVMEDGFFNTHKLSDQGLEDKTTILTDLKRYFKNLQVPAYYDQVAKLPFSLAISLSPDDLLARAMTTAQRPYHFLYYKKLSGLYFREVNKHTGEIKWKQREVTEEEDRSDDMVLFNFLGHYSDTESLIFTYDVLFDFLYSIFPVSNLSLKLRTIINKAESFLFLGFGYDKWYLKIIFFTIEKILEGRKAKKAIFNYSEKNKPTVQFYENQFQLNFFQESTIDFINKLYEDCAARGILKTPVQQQPAATGVPAKYKILFFAANPNSLNPLNYAAEFNQIKDVLERKQKRDDYILPDLQLATTQDKLLLKISTENPHLVVISMHGSQETGLLFQDENGGKAPLSLPKFLKDIKVLKGDPLSNLECIVFSCCNSSGFAKEVCQYIPFAIGMNGPIQDEAMPVFHNGFFNRLFDDRNVLQGYEIGKRLVERDDELQENAALIEFYSRQ